MSITIFIEADSGENATVSYIIVVEPSGLATRDLVN
jgi:hypothetical protein